MTELSRPMHFFPIDKNHLSGMARPGFGHSSHESPKKPLSEPTLREIEATLIYLQENGYRCLISLGSSLYRSHDDHIQQVWERLGGEFHWIPNEDHAVEKHFKLGSGPTARKIHDCVTKSSGKKTALYCGEGTGRTGTYAIAYLLYKNPKLTVDEAFKKIHTAMFADRSPHSPTQLRDELTDNGGFAALTEYAERFVSSPALAKRKPRRKP